MTNPEPSDRAAETALPAEIRRRRLAAGLSQAELATKVGYSREYVSRAERPTKGLASAELVHAIDDSLDAGGTLVALHATARDARGARRRRTGPEQHVSVNDRENHVPLGALLGTELVDLAMVLQHSAASAASLDQLELTVARIHQNYSKVPPAELLPVVNDHLRWVTDSLKVGQTVNHRRKLCSIVGHLAGHRAWLMFDMRRPDEAVDWYRIALSAAQEADDNPLASWLLGGWSVVAFDAKNVPDALALLDRASHCTQRATHTPVAAWVAALKARAFATIGDARSARAALAQVHERDWLLDDGTYRHGMDVSRGALNVDYYEGGTLLALGEVPAARAAFTAALATQRDGRVKGHAVITLQVAMTYVQENEIDRAIELAASAWSIPAAQRIGPITDRVRQVRSMIGPAIGASATARLDELFADEPRSAFS